MILTLGAKSAETCLFHPPTPAKKEEKKKPERVGPPGLHLQPHSAQRTRLRARLVQVPAAPAKVG